MDNSYFTTVAPYFQQQDQGLSPVFQNIGAQQAMQNQALQQQMQNNQAAGQVFQQGGSGLNPLAMAAMLRNKQPGTGEMYDANGKIVKDPTYGDISQSSVMKNPTFNPYENPI